MPKYCFIDVDTEEPCELFLTISQLEEARTDDARYVVDGRNLRRDFHAEHTGVPSIPGKWPMVCDAAGVAPSQRKEAMEYCRKCGVPTEYNADGDPVLTSRKHRKRFLQSQGLFDKDAGYSDPTPTR